MRFFMRTFSLALALALSAVSSTALADDEEKTSSSVGSLDPSLRGPGSLADASPQRRHPMISFFAGFPAVYWGFGGVPLSLGARYLQPILHDGFAPTLNDSFSIEAGVDLYAIGRASFAFGLSVPIEAMWALHFSARFAAYLKLGIALALRFGDWCWGNVCGGALGIAPEFIGNLGIMYKLTEGLVLRVEAGYPGLRVGLGFPL
jgi:hypothetical protein